MAPRSGPAAEAPNSLKMSERRSGTGGRIGPNAVTQLAAALEAEGGRDLLGDLMAKAGLPDLPGSDEMIDERIAQRLHGAVRSGAPGLAPAILADAGRRTADYILAHRIPGAAKIVLRVMPEGVAARLLAAAIARHAWTFAGSGHFDVVSPARFELRGNPLIRGEQSEEPLCCWHEAVFNGLYGKLVSPRMRWRETTCAAQGAAACVFERQVVPQTSPDPKKPNAVSANILETSS